VNKTGAGIPVAAASPGGSIAPPAANRLPYQLRFEGRIYRAVYERQMDEGRPIDVYFFPMRLADGSQPLQDGSPLFGRFVRIPAASDPDQSRVEWAAAWWVLRNGRWEIAARRPAQVELLGRNE
jgi:hypothetical protein